MALPAKQEIRRRLRDSYDLDNLYRETMGTSTGDTKEKPLRELAALLEATGTPYALIGGVAVQLYSREPRSTKDIDIAVPTFADIPREALERAGFAHERRFAHSDNWRAPGPGARKDRVAVPFSAEDVGIATAVARATYTELDAGLRVRLATVPDLVILKLAAAAEPRRRASKRSQDCTDILKLIEEHPEVRAAVPDIQARILQLVTQIATANVDVDVGEGEE
ncbi:MAG TPA: nucleotidyl transferase AbiEii/AbiGii toxin family protein [Polyangiaceae bacterium]|nr:nucleotidyl transferase AbiEii/AbiGii toxin family protein [Polyangiaceae bacterium]